LSTITSLLATGYWLLATSTLALQIPPPVDGPVKTPELRGRRDAILAQERAKLEALADRLRSEGKAAEAEQIAADLGGSSPDGSSRFVPLPEVVAAKPKGLNSVDVSKPKDAVAKEVGRPGREAIRLEAAKALFDLASQAAKPPESFALADECLRGVLERQPDHAEARRLLGFVEYKGGWATPFAVRKLDEGSVYDTTYGWVKADWIPHLGRGELPDRSLRRWLPAAEADALRRDWASKWEISTEHFRIYTNVPLNEAISFGRKLEDFHQLFFSLMADVIDQARLPLAQRFSKKPAARPAGSNARGTYRVYYFATRDEYAQYLAPYQGEGAKTSLGTYVPLKESKQFGGTSYFFNDVNGQLNVESTLFHEASHQLLFESAGADDYARNTGQYWVFEGLGTYFETLQHEPDGTLRIGGLVGPRVAQARRRLIDRKEFIPIDQFVSFGRARFQGDIGGGDIYLNYAQSMALAIFLMQADGGRHREGFLEYVRDVYKGRYRGGSGRSLQDEVGTAYPELNRGLLDYLARAEKP
jgi:Protein of unknown function (DUF1570)